MNRKAWLHKAEAELKAAGIASAHLDSELLLTHALDISRTALHAHDDEMINPSMMTVLEAMLSLRIIRVPLAYIVGHREFYGRLFKITPSVLIPRPETEDIITIVKELPPFESIVDVGTGSGALAVTLALEHPEAFVAATDISQNALAVARINADSYQAPVQFAHTDLLSHLEYLDLKRPLCVVANLPYVADSDERSPETDYEPEEALFARDDGLALIKKLIEQARDMFGKDDYLILEANPEQHPAIVDHSKKNGFTLEQSRNLITVLKPNSAPKR